MQENGLKITMYSPGWVVKLVGALSCTPKGCGFDSWSGHIPRLQVWSPVRVCTGGNQSMFLSLPPFLSLSKVPYCTILSLLLVMPWDHAVSPWWGAGGWHRHCDVALGCCTSYLNTNTVIPWQSNWLLSQLHVTRKWAAYTAWTRWTEEGRVQGGSGQGGTRFHHATQDGTPFKT